MKEALNALHRLVDELDKNGNYKNIYVDKKIVIDELKKMTKKLNSVGYIIKLYIDWKLDDDELCKELIIWYEQNIKKAEVK